MLIKDALPPPIRLDLTLFPGPSGEDGAPSWTLFDPLRQRFFRLGWVEGVIFSQWQQGGVWEVVVKGARGVAGGVVTWSRVEGVAHFLAVNELLQGVGRDDVKKLMLRHQARQSALVSWLFHHYLFVKIPLWHPDRFLAALLPVARLLVSKFFLFQLAFVGGLGLYLTFRQWDLFLHAIPDLPTPAGALMLALAVGLAKLVHELGHAFAAHHYGCRVPSMGLALIVLWPVLYADTSETWKLASKKSRLHVGLAGVGAELGLALLATFGWHFFSAGPVRDALVLLAAVTWISTLAINLNPCMRFDGYYLLADGLGVPNLGERAFALARWHARELLFAVGWPEPEQWPAVKRRILLSYSYITWIYRVIVFIGIALLVYHKFFKLAGIILMAAEVGWFVLWPVARFFYQTPWGGIRRGRLVWLFLLVLGCLSVGLIPWRQSVEVPALLLSKEHLRLYAPTPAQVTAVFVRAGDVVRAGTPLMQLRAPDLEQALKDANARLRVLELEAEQMVANPSVLATRLTLVRRLAEVKAEQQGYLEQTARLTLTAPFAGEVTSVQSGLVAGRWVARTTVLMELINPDQQLVEAWVPETDILRLSVGAAAEFWSLKGVGESMPVRLISMDRAAMEQLTRPHLASLYGGPIDVRQDGGKRVVPTQAWYRVVLTLVTPLPKLNSTLPGSVRIAAQQQTPFARIWRAVAAVWIRERGF